MVYESRGAEYRKRVRSFPPPLHFVLLLLPRNCKIVNLSTLLRYFSHMCERANPIFWLVLGGICSLSSCGLLSKQAGINLATSAPATASPHADAVSVEIYIVRLSPHQNELLQQLWREVDEQSLPVQLRRDLFAEGFRVGVLGNLISPALARLLSISGDAKTAGGEFQEFSVADAARATVNRYTRPLLPDTNAMVRVFDEQNTLPELSLFWMENGLFCGRTYTNALGLILVGAAANNDGSAQLQIVPAVEHGYMEQRIRTVAGIIFQDDSRPRYTFEPLRISQRLLPGQWLIMGTTTPDSAGAGKAFFVRDTPETEQRLLAIRLVHVTPTVVSSASSLPSTAPRMAGTMPERY